MIKYAKRAFLFLYVDSFRTDSACFCWAAAATISAFIGILVVQAAIEHVAN